MAFVRSFLWAMATVRVESLSFRPCTSLMAFLASAAVATKTKAKLKQRVKQYKVEVIFGIVVKAETIVDS